MQVDQLWLKRNPLMPAGAIPLAHLLMHNSYLQVLDLVNTGLLDEVCSTHYKNHAPSLSMNRGQRRY